jgi:antitoxin component YwqK of YwqJK toxin-antitoxin module
MGSKSKIHKAITLIIISEILFTSFLFGYILNINNKDKESDEACLILNKGLIFIEGDIVPFTGRIQDTLSNNLIVEFNVVNGVKDGQYLVFNTGGKLVVSGWIKQNKNFGPWEYYYDNGQLRCIGSYLDDKQSGKWIWYQRNGLKECEGTFLNGSMQGKFLKYDDNGDVKFMINYISGEVINFVEYNKPIMI